MNSTNKKSPGARGIPQPFNRQAGHAPQFKPAVAQLKTAVSAQSVKQPVAPPVYRPQAQPKVLQTKSSSAQSLRVGQASRRPVAPAVYRPEAKKIVQPKAISQLRRSPTAPPVYRPEQKGIAQPKMAAAAQVHKSPKAPSVYRPSAMQANAQSSLPAQMKSKLVGSQTPPVKATVINQSRKNPPGQQRKLVSARGRTGGAIVQRDVVDGRGEVVLDRFNRPVERAQTIAAHLYEKLWLNDRLGNTSFDDAFEQATLMLPSVNDVIDDPSVKIPITALVDKHWKDFGHQLWLKSDGGTKLKTHEYMLDKSNADIFRHYNFFDRNMLWRFTSLPSTEFLYIAPDATHQEIASVVSAHSGGNDKSNPRVKTLSFGRNLGALIGVAASKGGDKRVLNIADKAEYVYGIDINSLAAKGISAHPATARFISLFETEYVLLCTPGDPPQSLDSIATVKHVNPFKGQALKQMLDKEELQGMKDIEVQMGKVQAENVNGAMAMANSTIGNVLNFAKAAKNAANQQSGIVKIKEDFDESMIPSAMKSYLGSFK